MTGLVSQPVAKAPRAARHAGHLKDNVDSQMKILAVSSLLLPDVKVIRFARFVDHRGYFAEPFRRSDFDRHPDLSFLKNVALPQMNESFSRAGVVRGLHFQWSPAQGKLLRTQVGRMVDIFLDIRHGSPSFGQAAMHDMPAGNDADFSEWIWVPPGFAHGNFFTVDSRIEYLCSGEYNASAEAGISPVAADIDWSLCDVGLKQEFDRLIANAPLMSDKDRNGPTLSAWKVDHRSRAFVYGG
jgi:dTDP-4-dehydrorhamnose 3,5-epimerase